MTHSHRRQRGLSLATALFVITVMALLAVMIFQLVRSNAETTGEEVRLTRAFYAAESGVQFGLNAVFPPAAGARSCPATFTLEADGLAGCEAEVSCTSVTVDGSDYHTITSKGICGEVSRTIQVRAK
jgi:MSHA biogenesis protein MshP